jgi:hypothetical protein
MFQQRLHDAKLEVPDCAMKRSVTRPVARIYEGGILREEFADPLNVPYTSGVMDTE